MSDVQHFPASTTADELEDAANDHVFGCGGKVALVVEVYDLGYDPDEHGDLFLLFDGAVAVFDRDPLAWCEGRGFDNCRTLHRAEPIEEDA